MPQETQGIVSLADIRRVKMTRRKTTLTQTIWIGVVALLAPWVASASYVELSAGFFFHQTNYGGPSYRWTRQWNSAAAYHFFGHSGLEFSFYDIYELTKVDGVQDTWIHDQLYSINWIQSLVPEDFIFQPYVRTGIGQLNREQGGEYIFDDQTVSPARRKDAITVVLGGGAKIFLMKRMALRFDVTSYLDAGRISSYRDNIRTTVGTSFFF